MRKRKYTAEAIMKIADENLNEGTGKSEEKYGIDRSTIIRFSKNKTIRIVSADYAL